MDRAELERLDRATLIARADALGVARANILTRPELVDELLVRTARKGDRDLPRARGFFGRARDLVARVIEKGLHLPDAADRLRQVSVSATQIAARVAPAVVPTVTLAEIYAAQGHRPRAVEILRRLLDLEPDHAAAKALLVNLEAAPSAPPVVVPPPPEDEDDAPVDVAGDASPDAAHEAAAPQQEAPARAASPEVASLEDRTPEPAGVPDAAAGFLDDAPLPVRYDVDECVAIAVDPVTLYVYWEVRRATFEHIRRLRPEGTLSLRLLIITPSWDGPRSVARDFEVDSTIANRTVRDLPAGAIVRAGVGWRTGDAFLPIAHSPALETPPGARCPVVAESFVRWTPQGAQPVTARDADFASIGRALERLAPVREAVVQATVDAAASHPRAATPLGPAEVSAGFAPTAERQPGAAPSSEALL
jgi:hypothetical protein